MHDYISTDAGLIYRRHIRNDARVLLLDDRLIHDVQRLPLPGGHREDRAPQGPIGRLLIRKQVVGGRLEATEATKGIADI